MKDQADSDLYYLSLKVESLNKYIKDLEKRIEQLENKNTENDYEYDGQ